MILMERNNSIRAITQPTHAWVSGELARQWGNKFFSSFHPHSEVLLAAFQHDCGWADWELDPEFNRKTGLPYNFLNMPFTSHLEIWKRSTRQMSVQNSYAALLILRHSLFLFDLHDFESEPEEYREAADSFLISEKMLEQKLLNRLRYQYERTEYSTGNLAVNQAFIRTWDYLSLYACMGKQDEETVMGVPVNDKETVPMVIRCPDNEQNCYLLQPWPFDRDVVTMTCECRYMEKESVDNQSLDHLFLNNEPERISFRFCRS